MALRLLSLMGAALILTSCANAPVLTGYFHVSGVPGTFTYAGADRDFTVVLVGNPFAEPKAEVERVITDAMQGRHHGPSTHFTATPSANARTNCRFVFMFDPPRALDASTLCEDLGRLKAAVPSGGLRIMAAFCAKDRLMVEILARSGPAKSVRDPVVHDLIGRITWSIIPYRDPYDQDDDNPSPLIIP